MSEKNPTLQDVWRLLGTMSKRFDGLERQMVQLKDSVAQEFAVVKGDVARLRTDLTGSISSLKASIEARDFRLDEHGRRLTELVRSRT